MGLSVDPSVQIPAPVVPGAAHQPQCACVRHLEHCVNELHGSGQYSLSSACRTSPQTPPMQYRDWYEGAMHSSSCVDQRQSARLLSRQVLQVEYIEQDCGQVRISFVSRSRGAGKSMRLRCIAVQNTSKLAKLFPEGFFYFFEIIAFNTPFF